MLLGAAIPIETADHPSVRGFMKEYTNMAVMLHSAHELPKEGNIKTLFTVHNRAIRCRLDTLH